MYHNDLDTFFALKCFYCDQFNQSHIKCNICGIATYCNQEHQRLHWETHQFQCKYIKVEPSKEFVNNANTCDKLELNTNLKEQVDDVNRKSPPANIINVKSFRAFPIFQLPEGISKEEIIRKHANYASNVLNNEGYCVIDGFLGEAKLDCILSEVHVLMDSGIMKDGLVIKPTEKNKNEERIRGDKITWISGEEEPYINMKSLIIAVDHLISFCDGCFQQVIKGRTQAMVACYSGDGVGYKYHIDNAHNDGRCITCLYYMNKDWDSELHGGSLRMYPSGEQSFVDIDPVADRLLIFWSDSRTPHEVLPPFRKRFAITLWYFDAKEREEFRKSYLDNLKNNFSSG